MSTVYNNLSSDCNLNLIYLIFIQKSLATSYELISISLSVKVIHYHYDSYLYYNIHIYT